MKIFRSVLKKVNFDLHNEELDFDNSLSPVHHKLHIIDSLSMIEHTNFRKNWGIRF